MARIELPSGHPEIPSEVLSPGTTVSSSDSMDGIVFFAILAGLVAAPGILLGLFFSIIYVATGSSETGQGETMFAFMVVGSGLSGLAAAVVSVLSYLSTAKGKRALKLYAWILGIGVATSILMGVVVQMFANAGY